MKKGARTRHTELDQLTVKLHAALSCETTNVIEIGNLLIKSRYEDESNESSNQ